MFELLPFLKATLLGSLEEKKNTHLELVYCYIVVIVYIGVGYLYYYTKYYICSGIWSK